MPAELGVSTREQLPELRLQLESTAAPRDDGPFQRRSPVGVEDCRAVSSTLAVQVVEEFVETAEGEQTMVVEVGSCTRRETPPELALWYASPV